MQSHTTPSAHVCTPRPERRTKPRNYGHVIAGDGSNLLTGATPPSPPAAWESLSFAQREVRARDQLRSILNRLHYNGDDVLALTFALASLNISIEDRAARVRAVQRQGGAA